MSTTLREALARGADRAGSPELDVEALIDLGERRLRRRQLGVVLGSAAAVLVVIALVIGGASLIGPSRSTGPIDKPSPDEGVTQPARKIVYRDGLDRFIRSADEALLLHYGNRVVDVSAAGYFSNLDVTDDGVVFTSRHGIWFTDGSGSVRLGLEECSAYSTHSFDAVLSGNSGSLVTWFRCTAERGPDALMVYDTAKRRMVVDRPMPACRTPRVWADGDVSCSVDAPVGDHVYWTRTVRTRRFERDQHFRYDVSTGRRIPVTARDYVADLRNNGRSLVVGDSWETGRVADGIYQTFRVAGSRLVPTGRPMDPGAPTDTSLFAGSTGKRVQLRITGYESGTEFTLFEWLSDDNVALSVQGGLGGPPPYGDILRCQLSTGHCERAVRGTHEVRVFPNLWLPA